MLFLQQSQLFLQMSPSLIILFRTATPPPAPHLIPNISLLPPFFLSIVLHVSTTLHDFADLPYSLTLWFSGLYALWGQEFISAIWWCSTPKTQQSAWHRAGTQYLSVEWMGSLDEAMRVKRLAEGLVHGVCSALSSMWIMVTETPLLPWNKLHLVCASHLPASGMFTQVKIKLRRNSEINFAGGNTATIGSMEPVWRVLPTRKGGGGGDRQVERREQLVYLEWVAVCKALSCLPCLTTSGEYNPRWQRRQLRLKGQGTFL